MFLVYLIIAQIIVFAGLLIALRKIMYLSSVKEVKRLQELTKDTEKTRQELNIKVEEAKIEYEQKISNAVSEAKEIKLKAQEEIENLRQQIISKAKLESENILNQALNAKQNNREEIKLELKKELSGDCFAAVLGVLSSKNQKLLHDGLVEDILEELAEFKKGQIEVKETAGFLISAYELEINQKQKLLTVLRDKICSNIVLEEKMDKNLGAGLIIKFGNTVIDASLAGRIREKI